jgi:hypothetical protein
MYLKACESPHSFTFLYPNLSIYTQQFVSAPLSIAFILCTDLFVFLHLIACECTFFFQFLSGL